MERVCYAVLVRLVPSRQGLLPTGMNEQVVNMFISVSYRQMGLCTSAFVCA